MDTLNKLQSEAATRVKQNEAAFKAEKRPNSARLVPHRQSKKVHNLQLQMKLAQEDIEAARGRQEVLQAAKDKHERMVQRYHDYQADLEQLARIREEQMKGLRSLNVPSFETILAASMDPMIRRLADQYPGFFGNDAFTKVENPC